MPFNEFIAGVKNFLKEGDHIDEKEDTLRKYLFLKLAETPKLKNYYENPNDILVAREKFYAFFNIHGPALNTFINDEVPNPLTYLSNILFKNEWYHENIPYSGASLEKDVKKKRKEH